MFSSYNSFNPFIGQQSLAQFPIDRPEPTQPSDPKAMAFMPDFMNMDLSGLAGPTTDTFGRSSDSTFLLNMPDDNKPATGSIPTDPMLPTALDAATAAYLPNIFSPTQLVGSPPPLQFSQSAIFSNENQIITTASTGNLQVSPLLDPNVAYFKPDGTIVYKDELTGSFGESSSSENSGTLTIGGSLYTPPLPPLPKTVDEFVSKEGTIKTGDTAQVGVLDKETLKTPVLINNQTFYASNVNKLWNGNTNVSLFIDGKSVNVTLDPSGKVISIDVTSPK